LYKMLQHLPIIYTYSPLEETLSLF
jgi:hypothetical protein